MWQGYDSKAYGVSNHNLKLQCKKFNRTRDIRDFPTQGWADTTFCTRKRSETYKWDYFYHPQMKLQEGIMFLHLSFCSQGVGAVPFQHATGWHPPPRMDPPGPGRTSTPGQQAGSSHPTGMLWFKNFMVTILFRYGLCTHFRRCCIFILYSLDLWLTTAGLGHPRFFA